MNCDPARQSAAAHPPSDLSGADERDLIREAFAQLGGSLSGGGEASWKTPLARQKRDLCEWAERLGLQLSPEDLPSKSIRGGQEHDLFHEVVSDRYYKVTRHGIFGLSPGIDLAMVSSSQDGRRFHLWEATPLEYLERLLLHNELVPGINRLEGVICQSNGEVSIVTSQPRLEIVSVSEEEIGEWFASLGFLKITHSAYYRVEDNLAIFDAHDKNVIRAGETMIPFDIIPCRPLPGFLKFITDTLEQGHTVQVLRTVSTSPPPTAFHTPP